MTVEARRTNFGTLASRMIRRDYHARKLISVPHPKPGATSYTPSRTETENYRLPSIYRLPLIVLGKSGYRRSIQGEIPCSLNGKTSFFYSQDIWNENTRYTLSTTL